MCSSESRTSVASMPVVAVGLSSQQQHELQQFLAPSTYHLTHRISDAKVVFYNPQKDTQGVLWKACRVQYAHLPVLVLGKLPDHFISIVGDAYSAELETWDADSVLQALHRVFRQAQNERLSEVAEWRIIEDKAPCVFFSETQLHNPELMFYSTAHSLENLIHLQQEKQQHKSQRNASYYLIEGLPDNVLVNFQQAQIWFAPRLAQRWAQIVSMRQCLKPRITVAPKTMVAVLKRTAPEAEQWMSMSLEAFLWQISVYHSRGRLPQGIDLNTHFQLSVWPNFPRLMPLPYALNLAALWYRTPLSIQQVLNSKRFPRSAVFAFVSATHTLGYLRTQSEPSTAPQETADNAKKGHKLTHLLNKLLVRLCSTKGEHLHV